MSNYIGYFSPFVLTTTIGAALMCSCFMSVKTKYSKRHIALHILIVAALYLIMQSLVNPLPFGPLRVILNLSALMFVILTIELLFDGERPKKILIAVLYFTIQEIAEFFAMYFFNLELVSNRPGIYNAAATDQGTWSSLIGLAIIIFIKIKRQKKNIAIDIKVSLLHILIAVVCVVPMFTIMITCILQGTISIIQLMSVTAFLLLLILFYIAFEITDAVHRQNQEYQLQEQRHQLMQEYYGRVEAQQHEIRAIKHDLKNQLISLSAYSESGDEHPVKIQLNKLIERLSGHTKYDFTAHSGMNAILGLKFQDAESEGIICEFDARLPSDIMIEETDLAIVTGNILDNAIEACRYCIDKQYIRFLCVYHNNSIIISSENSTDGTVNSLDTRKKDKRNHGLGMKSINNIVNKYNGQMQYEFFPHHFTINLTLFENHDKETG